MTKKWLVTVTTTDHFYVKSLNRRDTCLINWVNSYIIDDHPVVWFNNTIRLYNEWYMSDERDERKGVMEVHNILYSIEIPDGLNVDKIRVWNDMD